MHIGYNENDYEKILLMGLKEGNISDGTGELENEMEKGRGESVLDEEMR